MQPKIHEHIASNIIEIHQADRLKYKFQPQHNLLEAINLSKFLFFHWNLIKLEIFT